MEVNDLLFIAVHQKKLWGCLESIRTISHPLTLTAIPRGFEAEIFTGQMSFLSPNQWCPGIYNYCAFIWIFWL